MSFSRALFWSFMVSSGTRLVFGWHIMQGSLDIVSLLLVGTGPEKSEQLRERSYL
jgi:hypothetical protein